MRTRNNCLILLAGIISTPLLASSSKTQTLTYSIGGCATGLAVGALLDSRDQSEDKSSAATIAINTSIGCLLGMGSAYFFADESPSDQKVQELETELSRYRELNKNIPIANDQNLQHLPPENYLTRCAKGLSLAPFCSDSDGSYSSCDKEAEFFILDPKLAVKIIGFHSPDGCFKGPYMKNQKLKLHLDKEIKQLETLYKNKTRN